MRDALRAQPATFGRNEIRMRRIEMLQGKTERLVWLVGVVRLQVCFWLPHNFPSHPIRRRIRFLRTGFALRFV